MARTTRFLLALFVLLTAFATPREAEARSVACDPQGHCYSSIWDCATLQSPPSTIPKGWTCTDKFVVNPKQPNFMRRDRNGSIVVTANGKPIVILSDALDARIKRQKPAAAEFSRLVRADLGPVSEQSLNQVRKHFGIPVAKTAERSTERAKRAE